MLEQTLTMDGTKRAVVGRRRWGLASAALGGAFWLGAPVTGLTLASIEHLLLFMPMVGVPLGMLLHARLIDPGSEDVRPRLAQLLQPFAALMVLASFTLPKGPIAGLLVGLWGLTAIVFLATGRFRAGLNVAAAQVFMPIGALWLVFTRLGLHPAGLSDDRVLIAALHFQFSGFAVQLIGAATLVKASQRWIRLGLASGIPLIAVGNLAAVAPLRVLGVFTVIAATLGLATVLVTSSRPVALKVAGFALLAAMSTALVYGVGQLAGVPVLDASLMARTHGVLNALGFTLFGLAGHLRQPCSQEMSERRE